MLIAAVTMLSQSASAFYDPGQGRWMNRDPIAEADGLNVYCFVRNDPVRFIDYLGLWKLSERERWPGIDKKNTVKCEGGKPVPQIGDPDPRLKKCQLAHEQSHIDDIIRENGDICKGVANGTIVIPSSPEEKQNSERKAYKEQLECLKKLICNKGCRDDRDNRIREIEADLALDIFP
jgi:hypothetical protein